MEKILLTQAIGGLCPQRRNCKIASASVMAIRLYFFFFFFWLNTLVVYKFMLGYSTLGILP